MTEGESHCEPAAGGRPIYMQEVKVEAKVKEGRKGLGDEGMETSSLHYFISPSIGNCLGFRYWDLGFLIGDGGVHRNP